MLTTLAYQIGNIALQQQLSAVTRDSHAKPKLAGIVAYQQK